MQNEIWKDIKGYEGLYQISNFGNVKSLARKVNVENKFDYGIAAGLGLEYSHPKLGHFILEGRYYYGLGDIYGNSKRDYFGRSNNNNVIIKLTYLYDIRKTKK